MLPALPARASGVWRPRLVAVLTGDLDAVEPRVVEPQDPAVVPLGKTVVVEPVAQRVQVVVGGDLDPDQSPSASLRLPAPRLFQVFIAMWW